MKRCSTALVWLVVLWVVMLPPAATPAAAAATPAATPAATQPAPLPLAAQLGNDSRGALGWGLALELPMVGVATQAGQHSSAGWGFALGVGLLYEPWRTVALRLGVTTQQTYAARSLLRYSEGGTRLSDRQFADWNGIAADVGVAYLLRDLVPGPWLPYVGAGVALGHSGFLVHFDNSLDKLEPVDIDATPDAETHPALGRSLGLQARMGVRLALAPWLVAQMEVSAQGIWLGERKVLNTREPRRVTSPAQRLLVAHTAFSFLVLL